MAIVKMKQLHLMALLEDRPAILQQLQRMGCVEVDQPSFREEAADWVPLQRPDMQALSRAREERQAGEHAITVLNQYAPEKGGLFRTRAQVSEAELFDPTAGKAALQAARDINGAQRRIQSLCAEQSKLQGNKAALAPWLTLDVPLDLPSTRETAVEFATVPAAISFDEMEGAALAVSELVQLQRAGGDREVQYILFICHTAVHEEVQEILKGYGWTKANLREWSGTALENDRRIDARLEKITQEIAVEEDLIRSLGDRREGLRWLIDRAAQEIQREEARSRMVDTGTTFLLEGWVPAESWESVRQVLEQYSCAWEVKDPAEEDYPMVPVKLKNNALTQPLNMVTEMYSLPAYNGVDPNPLMAPFFILFYGIMMADMGYGLVMMLASVFVLKKIKPKKGKGMYHLFALMGLAGVSTFIMGAVTGGFFGDFIPQLLKLINPDSTFTWFYKPLFTPLDDTLRILIGSMALGAVHVITGMAIDFVKKIKDGHLIDGICDDVTWWVIFAGIALAILDVGTIAGIPVVLVTGCVMLVAGSGRNAKGFGKITAVFGAVYNGVTGYFGDILSYSRLMALMLAGSVIAQVFNTLGAIPGNIIVFIVVSLAGNTLNFALNLLGCYVHDLRLQCLEFFNKFYMDGGRPFKPLEFDTKFVDIVK